MVELHGEDYHDDIAPVDRLIIPSDICTISDEDEYIYIVGTQSGKVTKIDGLQNMTKLESLTLRCCLGKQFVLACSYVYYQIFSYMYARL